MKSLLPRVSIITIFLDAAQFLDEAVQSVLGQSFRDWELLLVDDGSQDASVEIARKYACHSAGRVIYMEHEGHVNKGMPASRNLGLAHARGEYLALLDADDVWEPERLAQHTAILDREPNAAMIYGPSRYWFSWTGEASRQDFVQRLGTQGDRLICPPELLIGFLRRAIPTPCPSSILVRTEIARRVGGFVEEMNDFFQVYEDQAFFFKVARDWPIYVSSRSLDLYRRHEKSCYAQAQSSGRKELARRHYLEWCQTQLSTRGQYDVAVMREVRRQLWNSRHPRLAALETKRHSLIKRAGRLLSGLGNGVW